MIIAAVISAVALAALVTNFVCRWLSDRLARGAITFEGHGFDAGGLQPRIATVREDYLSEIHARQNEREYHQQLMESARWAVSRLAFFQRSYSEQAGDNVKTHTTGLSQDGRN